MIGSMVVMMVDSHRRSPGKIPWRSQINSLLLPQNWCIETMGQGDHEVMCRGGQLSLAE